MRALVTGATGKVGHAIASALLDRGDQVRALVRDPAGGEHPPRGHRAVRGDVTDPESLGGGRRGLRAGLQLDGDAGAVGHGTRRSLTGSTPLAAAQLAGAAKRGGRPPLHPHLDPRCVSRRDADERFDETMRPTTRRAPPYERSKQHAEELVLAERDGMEVVILNLSGVYGADAPPTPSFENGIFEPVVRKRLPASRRAGTGYATPGA